MSAPPPHPSPGRLDRERIAGGLRRRRHALQGLARWYLGSERESRHRLQAMKDSRRGERCFILGNGPSLNRTDLSLLAEEVTFGLNRIYLKFEEIGYSTDYLVCVNEHVLEQFADDFRAVESTRVFGLLAGAHFQQQPNLLLVPTVKRPGFSLDPTRGGLHEGDTVTFVALQLAYWLGFERVVLVGVDHRFSTSGPAHELVTSTGADPNHFDPNYFGTGVTWQLPDLAGSERSYELARRVFEADGRSIVDATVDGELRVFPKVSLEQAVAGPGRPAQ